MSSDIISALNLDKESPDGRVFLVRELHGSDASFITSCVLSHQIKHKSELILITLHNSLNHFQNIGLKMGFNLDKQIESGLAHVINPGQDFLASILGDNESFIDILLKITVKVKDIVDKSTQTPVCIYVDGLSHMFDLKFSIPDLNKFARSLIHIIDSSQNAYIFFNCFVASEDDHTHILSNLIAHMSYTIIETDSLSTGRSADVSGHLIVRHPGRKFEPEYKNLLTIAPTHYHFKLFDRGIKLFAPGTV